MNVLSRFVIPPELIPHAVDIATVVSQIEAGEGNVKKYLNLVEAWAAPIIDVRANTWSPWSNTWFIERF